MISRRTLNAAVIGAFSSSKMAGATERWLVYYSNREPIKTFEPYSWLILDSQYHPPLAALATMGKNFVGYVSLGEASPHYSYFEELKSEGLLVRPSPTWEGNYYIDIRDTRWLSRVREKIIPQVLRQGFQGLFLDTLDSPLYLEQRAPTPYGGMAAAAVQLVREIRRAYPRITLVVNRAYSLLERLDADIDVALGESVYATFDFGHKKYRLVDPPIYRQQVEWLQAAARRRPGLRIFTLDYWEPSDQEGIARIYREERANGFVPYVATIDLTTVVREPGAMRLTPYAKDSR